MITRALRAALAALMLALSVAPAGAQTASPAPAALPKRPIPYTALAPKRPAPRSAAKAAPSAVAAAGAVAPTGPAVAGAPLPIAPGAAPAIQGAKLVPGQALPPAELEAFVDGVVRDAMARDHVAGVTVSVVQNGQVALKKGYGFASLAGRRPVDPDRTLFRVGSISKTFTWIGVMKEVEAGRIRLNQPVNLYLPERTQVRDQGYETPVRVINLMDHSAGFEDRALGHIFERDFQRVRPLALYLRQERPRRVRAPGAVASYSNYGVALAGEAIAYTSGKPFERLMEDAIFTPLGMRHTTFREPHAAKAGLPFPMAGALAQDVSEPFRWTPTGYQAQPYEYIGHIAPAGSASSTAGDMARYMIALLNGGQLEGVGVYGPVAAKAFRAPIRKVAPGMNGWAHGFMTYPLGGGFQAYGHAGDTVSFHSNMVTVPALGLGIFISTNTNGGADLAGRLPERVVREFYGRPQAFPRSSSQALAASPATFEGYYLTTRRAYSGLEGFVNAIGGGVTAKVTGGGKLVTSSDTGVRIWVPEGDLSLRRFIAVEGDQRLVFAGGDPAASFATTVNAATLERQPIWRQPRVLGLFAGLTALAAVSTLFGIFLRNRREFRENGMQRRVSLLQNIQAGLWIAALALFGIWAAKSGDLAQVVYHWPGALLVTASACALVASAMTIVTILALPAVWRGGRRVDSWSALRKFGFTLTVLIYSAFAILLGLWGALSPWSG